MRRTCMVAHIVHVPQSLSVYIGQQLYTGARVDESEVVQNCEVFGGLKLCAIRFALFCSIEEIRKINARSQLSQREDGFVPKKVEGRIEKTNSDGHRKLAEIVCIRAFVI